MSILLLEQGHHLKGIPTQVDPSGFFFTLAVRRMEIGEQRINEGWKLGRERILLDAFPPFASGIFGDSAHPLLDPRGVVDRKEGNPKFLEFWVIL